eukprot:jgi/Botrbrau1/1485/Bobra.178_3s0040.2
MESSPEDEICTSSNSLSGSRESFATQVQWATGASEPPLESLATLLLHKGDEGMSIFSQESCSSLMYTSNAADGVPAFHIPGFIQEDPRTTSFMHRLPTDVLVVCASDLVYGPDCCTWDGGDGITKVVTYKSKTYAFKQAQWSWKYETEHELYRALRSSSSASRDKANFVMNKSFSFLREIEMAIHCRKLADVVKCEAVVVVQDPCKRVIGMLTKYYQKGTLNDLIFEEPPMTYSRKIDVALEVACILERLHCFGVVHGDLKAPNVLIADDGSLRFCDFGSSIRVEDPPSIDTAWYPFIGELSCLSACHLATSTLLKSRFGICLAVLGTACVSVHGVPLPT